MLDSNTKRTIHITKGADLKINIILESDPIDLNEVVVAGKTEISEVRTQVFNVTAIDGKKLYNTSSDLNQVLNRTTGVRMCESGGMGSGFNFSLNGFSGNQVKFFLHGVPMTNVGWSLSLNNIAERIEVYKGVVPVDLGAYGLGGAVNIVTNQKIKRLRIKNGQSTFDPVYFFNFESSAVQGKLISVCFQS